MPACRRRACECRARDGRYSPRSFEPCARVSAMSLPSIRISPARFVNSAASRIFSPVTCDHLARDSFILIRKAARSRAAHSRFCPRISGSRTASSVHCHHTFGDRVGQLLPVTGGLATRLPSRHVREEAAFAEDRRGLRVAQHVEAPLSHPPIFRARSADHALVHGRGEGAAPPP